MKKVIIIIIVLAIMFEIFVFVRTAIGVANSKPADTEELPCDKKCEELKQKLDQQQANLIYWL